MSKSQPHESSSTTPEAIAAKVPRSDELRLADLKIDRLMQRHTELVIELRRLICDYQGEADNTSEARKIKALGKERISLEADMTRTRIDLRRREDHGVAVAKALAPTAAAAAKDFLAAIEQARAAAAAIGQCARVAEMKSGQLPNISWVNFNLLEAEARHIIEVTGAMLRHISGTRAGIVGVDFAAEARKFVGVGT